MDSISSFAIKIPTSNYRSKYVRIANNVISNINKSKNQTGPKVFNVDSLLILDNNISYCEWSGIAVGRNSNVQNQQKTNYLLIDHNDISYTLSDGLSAQGNIVV